MMTDAYLFCEFNLEAKQLRLSNNISAKPLPQFLYLDIHAIAKRSLKEIFW